MSAIERLRATVAHAGRSDAYGLSGELVRGALAEHDEVKRDLTEAWAAIGPTMPTPASLAERIAKLRADRDRLAARVAELEAASLQRWRALQPLTDMLGTGGEMFAWENLIAALRQRVEGNADADPCPVSSGVLKNWSFGAVSATTGASHEHAAETGERYGLPAAQGAEMRDLRRAVAWLTRRVGRGR